MICKIANTKLATKNALFWTRGFPNVHIETFSMKKFPNA